jgi:hypothetical protein
MLALLALIPVKDYLWAALVVGLVGFGLYERAHLIDEGEAHEQAQVTNVTKAAFAERNATLAKQAAIDAANLKTIEDSYANSLHLANATTDALNARLRNYEDASRRSVAVPGDSATPAGPDVPGSESDSVDEAIAGVISAAGVDGTKIAALQQYILKECH